ncbi:exodeoxyribonuclease V, a chain [Serratia symbiotica str. 'Cinara cedri']|nr:exodeoxyribonuclease V, a chain [Serratia symbiotica str. 'Cinara cedri']
MITLLNRAVGLGVLRPLDIQFANIVATEDQPDIFLAAACVSAEVGIGNVCLMLDQMRMGQLFTGLPPQLAKAIWLEAGQPDIAQWRRRLITCSAVSNGSSAAPLVLQGERLYLQRMWQSEGEVAAFFSSSDEYKLVDDSELRNVLDQLFIPTNGKLDWQKIAAAVAVTRRIVVISGGPGTGKTTTVTKLLAALIQLHKCMHLRIALAAPTGKAATRLTESLANAVCKLDLTPAQYAQFPTEATTLHRLLGMQFNSQRIYDRYDNKLDLDVLVVDEASMIDLSMMARLIRALPKYTRVIFLGDRNQLSSVEPGAVFGDICSFSEQGYSKSRAAELSSLSGYVLRGQQVQVESLVRDSLCLLRKNYRFDAKSGIAQLARAVNVGDIALAVKVLSGGFRDVMDYSLATTEEYQALLVMCVAGYQNYMEQVIVRDDAITILKTFSSFQVLCALRTGLFGVDGLNQQIELELRRSNLIQSTQGNWYLGRPIMIERNDSVLGLYNGDIGITLETGRGKLGVYFLLPNGGIKLVQPNRLPAHKTAYAITVHKSQGSEFDHIALVLPNYFLSLLTRELIYTAITRARTCVSLYSVRAVLIRAICTRTWRCSGLIERLRAGNKR